MISSCSDNTPLYSSVHTHTHTRALQHIQWARLWHAFIPEAFSCQGKSLLSETVSHRMQWPLRMFLDSCRACYSDVRGLSGVADSPVCFHVPRCLRRFTFHPHRGKPTHVYVLVWFIVSASTLWRHSNFTWTFYRIFFFHFYRFLVHSPVSRDLVIWTFGWIAQAFRRRWLIRWEVG